MRCRPVHARRRRPESQFQQAAARLSFEQFGGEANGRGPCLELGRRRCRPRARPLRQWAEHRVPITRVRLPAGGPAGLFAASVIAFAVSATDLSGGQLK